MQPYYPNNGEGRYGQPYMAIQHGGNMNINPNHANLNHPNANQIYPQQQVLMNTNEGFYYPNNIQTHHFSQNHMVQQHLMNNPNLHRNLQQQQHLMNQLPPQFQGPLAAGLGPNYPLHNLNIGGMPIGSYPPDNGLEETIFKHVQNLVNPNTRVEALSALCTLREDYPNMALILWHSYGIIPILLMEVFKYYPKFYCSSFTQDDSHHFCNVLSLFQTLAGCKQILHPFVDSQIPAFLFTFIDHKGELNSLDSARLTALGVFGALLKHDDTEVIQQLIGYDLIPICLRIIDRGPELSQTVAIFIIQKILGDKFGLDYVCSASERFDAVVTSLTNVLFYIKKKNMPRLLKHVVKAFVALAENIPTRSILASIVPEQFRDGSLLVIMKDDPVTKGALANLFQTFGLEPIIR